MAICIGFDDFRFYKGKFKKSIHNRNSGHTCRTKNIWLMCECTENMANWHYIQNKNHLKVNSIEKPWRKVFRIHFPMAILPLSRRLHMFGLGFGFVYLCEVMIEIWLIWIAAVAVSTCDTLCVFVCS